MTGQSKGRRRMRLVLVAFAAALLLVAPLSFAVIQFWASRSEDVGAVVDERRGVQYVRPAVSLVSAISAAQSAAVRGDPPDVVTLRRALEEVGAVDARLGAALGTTARWTTLRDRIEELAERPPPVGTAAYRAYSEVAGLALALVAKAGDTSRLILDPELDSYYLMDTALLRLPAVLVDNGRYADLVGLAGTEPRQQATGYTSQAAVARDRVSVHADAVDEGLRRSLEASGRREPGPGLLGLMDGFRAAVNDVAPLVQLTETPQSVPAPGELGPRRAQLDRAALELDKAVLAELDSLLSAREDGLALQRLGIIGAAGLGLLGAVWMLWIALPAQHGQRRVLGGAAEEDDEPLPVDAVPGDDSLVLLDPRELLGQEELERVGRAVRRSRQEPEDDDQ